MMLVVVYALQLAVCDPAILRRMHLACACIVEFTAIKPGSTCRYFVQGCRARMRMIALYAE